MVILKSDFTKTNFQYVCLNTTEDNVSDMEFFDHQELCIVTYNKNDTILYTVQLDQLEYKDFTLKIESEDIKVRKQNKKQFANFFFLVRKEFGIKQNDSS